MRLAFENWHMVTKQGIIIFVVLIVTMIAFIYRGKQAVQGILWGLPIETLHQSEDEEGLVETDVRLGVYDPNEKFASSENFAVEHEFISWKKFDALTLRNFLQTTTDRNRWPLLTIEPNPREENGLLRDTLFSDVVAGKYDSVIDDICGEIGKLDKPVFIRWGHEMENVTGRYAWAQDDASKYILAYQYFVTKCRSSVSSAYYVWSPVGNNNLKNYWPGREYVDYVGVSVFIYPEWENLHYGRVRTFREIFTEKYNLVKDFDRPVMIAEFGIAGEKTAQQKAILQAIRDVKDFPLLKIVSFFNAIDTPGVWGEDMSTPNWDIDSAVVDKILYVEKK